MKGDRVGHAALPPLPADIIGLTDLGLVNVDDPDAGLEQAEHVPGVALPEGDTADRVAPVRDAPDGLVAHTKVLFEDGADVRL